jgi:anti-sigma factor RsiW
MNCQNAQRQFDDLADGRLPDSVADELRRHLAECTDCRVAEHRVARLQRLLALKRHEQPPAGYFNNFLGEFHQRLALANAPRPSWWDRFIRHLTIEPIHVWRYGLAGALGILATGMITWWSLPAGHPPTGENTAQLVASNTAVAIPVIATADTGLLRGMDADMAPLVESGDVILSPNATDAPDEPRYVLDRLAVTPVSYEAPNVHF